MEPAPELPFRIRVHILPWEANKDSDVKPTYQMILPASRDNTVQELCDRVEKQSIDLYQLSLNIAQCTDEEGYDISQASKLGTLFGDRDVIRIIHKPTVRDVPSEQRESLGITPITTLATPNTAGQKRKREEDQSSVLTKSQRRRRCRKKNLLLNGQDDEALSEHSANTDGKVLQLQISEMINGAETKPTIEERVETTSASSGRGDHQGARDRRRSRSKVRTLLAVQASTHQADSEVSKTLSVQPGGVPAFSPVVEQIQAEIATEVHKPQAEVTPESEMHLSTKITETVSPANRSQRAEKAQKPAIISTSPIPTPERKPRAMSRHSRISPASPEEKRPATEPKSMATLPAGKQPLRRKLFQLLSSENTHSAKSRSAAPTVPNDQIFPERDGTPPSKSIERAKAQSASFFQAKYLERNQARSSPSSGSDSDARLPSIHPNGSVQLPSRPVPKAGPIKSSQTSSGPLYQSSQIGRASSATSRFPTLNHLASIKSSLDQPQVSSSLPGQASAKVGLFGIDDEDEDPSSDDESSASE